MRKIAVVTGTRAEYGYLKPLMKAIQSDSELELVILITGMHLLSDFGNTYQIVENDFSKTVKIPMTLEGDSLKDMADYLSSGIINFADYLSENKPDIIIILGDRSESLAAVLATMYLNIPIAHINGGDISSGNIDESIRHAITKIAHIHFVHTQENADRLEKMGENKKRIFVTGALTLDTILNIDMQRKEDIFRKYNLDSNKTTFLVVQHPITTIEDKGYSQMEQLFLALDKLHEQTVVIYPNCDAGYKKFIQHIEGSNREYLYKFKSLAHEDYLSLMKSVDLMIGNSSSGIIEAPSLKTPVINIGDRQQGRNRSDNILDVKPKKDEILRAIDFVMHNKGFHKKVKNCVNKFGDGTASQRIVSVLKKIDMNAELIRKQITY